MSKILIKRDTWFKKIRYIITKPILILSFTCNMLEDINDLISVAIRTILKAVSVFFIALFTVLNDGEYKEGEND